MSTCAEFISSCKSDLDRFIKELNDKGTIFDYDGVISESVGIKGEGFSMIYKPYGKKIADKVIKHHHANGGVSRYEKFRFYHKNFLDIELNEFEMKALSRKFSLFCCR